MLYYTIERRVEQKCAPYYFAPLNDLIHHARKGRVGRFNHRL